ncbi:thiamine biosynthesis protein [Mrakia frigida]|uniref:thiamine biosynthesis protein n=1 Tax=Mrakia frigida TaxID=29902 RepID=UPI003FCC1568
MTSAAHPPSILTIAGSDPSGGAGIQADLKTFTSLSAYGLSVITALTSQNTVAVKGVHTVPPEFVAQQIQDVISDIPPAALKTGMLASAEIILSITTALQSLYSSPTSSLALPPLVIDPVTISTSGHTLLPESAVAALINHLIPLGTVITPNIWETELLLRRGAAVESGKEERKVTNVTEMMAAAKELAQLGCKGVLVKGGHLPLKLEAVREGLANAGGKGGEEVEIVWPKDDGVSILKLASGLTEEEHLDLNYVVDVLYEAEKGRFTAIVGKVIETSSTHGTGCTLSAAMAVFLGRGLNLRDATVEATRYVHNAIATSYPLGAGNGPLNHLHTITYRPLPTPTPADSLPFCTHIINEVKKTGLWEAYIHHPFVVELGKGTLDRRRFEHYIKQDWHYLRHYARAHSLAAFKTTDFDQIVGFSEISLHIARESQMHYCETFGISKEDLLATPETPSTSAYALYILDVGQRGDLLDLLLAVASCCLGYGEVGMKLAEGYKKGEVKMEGNLYKKWIEDYSGPEYLVAVTNSIKNLEKRLAAAPPSAQRLQELVKIWEECTRLEIGFWNGAMDLELEDLPEAAMKA